MHTSEPFAGATSVSGERPSHGKRKRVKHVTVERAKNGFSATNHHEDYAHPPETSVYPGGHDAIEKHLGPHMKRAFGIHAPAGAVAKDADD